MSLGAAAVTEGGASNGGTSGTGGAGSSTANAGAATGGATSTSGSNGAADAGSKGGVGTGATEGAKSWRDTLPDDIKNDPTLNKYSDITNLSKAHIELQKKFGQKGVFKPSKDASAEEIKAFREQMGIPTTPDKYDMGEFDKAVTIAPALSDWAKKIGSEQGVEPAAMKNIITDYLKLESQNKVLETASKKQAIKAGFDSLRTEWGESFQSNLDKANFTCKQMGGSVLSDALKKYGADNDPVILKAFADAAKVYGEDKLRQEGIGNSSQSPVELDAEIRQVQGRMMGMKPSDGAYPALLAKSESLWRQKTKGK